MNYIKLAARLRRIATIIEKILLAVPPSIIVQFTGTFDELKMSGVVKELRDIADTLRPKKVKSKCRS